MPVSTQVDLGRGTTADSVEATVLVEDDGTFDDQVVESDWGTFDGEIYMRKDP